MNAFTPNTEGIFLGLTADEYRAAPGIGQSMLKAFASEPTPKHYQESLTRPKVETDAIKFGHVLHTAILTPELLSSSYHLRPLEYPGPKGPKPWHGGADWCKEWIKDHSDRLIIDVDTEAQIQPIKDTVMSLPVAGDIIRTGQKEVSFFKKDEETGLLLKCRVDAIATDTDGNTHLVDLKKVRRGYADHDKFAIQCADLGYDIQCASYLHITGASSFMFVAMEEEAPFEATVWELDASDVAEGLNKWRRMLNNYALAVQENTWPGYERNLKRLKLPHWAKDKMKPEQESIYL